MVLHRRDDRALRGELHRGTAAASTYAPHASAPRPAPTHSPEHGAAPLSLAHHVECLLLHGKRLRCPRPVADTRAPAGAGRNHTWPYARIEVTSKWARSRRS